MSENTTKDFDPAVIASLTTGIVLVENGFSLIHEAAEWVVGHPIWTHEFGRKELWDNMRAKLLAQHPDLPLETTGEWRDAAEKVRARYGTHMAIKRGSDERTTDPVTSLREMTGDKPIVAIVN